MSEKNASLQVVSPIAVDEKAFAAAIGVSVAWLRKDRLTKRLIPFYRIGSHIRYSPERAREFLASCEEGGVQTKPRSRVSKVATA
ncbi:MAG: hypothetical protein JWP93_2328 [Polaromonas sp.]|nr:hypothetical protein [Polaromonas sp.]